MEAYDVLCVNCENLINIDTISEHSLECTAPAVFNIDQDKKNPLGEINNRLEILHAAIKNCYFRSSINNSTVCKKIFDFLIESIEKIKKINIEDTDSNSIINRSINKLNELQNEEANMACYIYIERLRALINEKEEVINQENQKISENMSSNSPYESNDVKALIKNQKEVKDCKLNESSNCEKENFDEKKPLSDKLSEESSSIPSEEAPDNRKYNNID